jgi:hypothetical protein
MKHQLGKYIVTLDEAWAYLDMDYHTILWALGEPKPDIKRLSKILVTVV